MNWQQHIHVDPAICKGRACVALSLIDYWHLAREI